MEGLLSRVARPSACLLAVLVLGLTILSVSRAYAEIIVPSHFETTLITTPGADSTPITLPKTNSPIIVTGTTITIGQRGTGFVHIAFSDLGAAGTDDILSWSGVHASGSAQTVAQNFTFVDNVEIVNVGFANNSELRSDVNPAVAGGLVNRIVVHNNSSVNLTHVIQMIW